MKKLLAVLLLVGLLMSSVVQVQAASVLADVGADMMLKLIFQNVTPSGGRNLTLKLYCTNVSPADTSVAGSFTACTGGGYADKTLTNGSSYWTESQSGGISQVLYADQVYTFTGALTTNGTIYGYYVLDADGVLVWAELFSSTFTPANNGDTLTITPKFQLSKGTPN